ncbi:hypothetical protein [Geomesophilobacter sediminis]|uniref:Uncharacterized protein n=1 Tax=Geomesophilobacter sediminis TaxID=2798584 RepID=A0A8J7JFV3_9BACT|nr:hypothetical protein [Geomesophilobacter sediminis]MBJ6723120.1 hypothetical protein [Geomesophilobacter sediminis]
MTSIQIFKQCPTCLTIWRTRDEFLCDPDVQLNGYKVDFKELEFGLFFFTHKKENCISSIVFEARDFVDLYQGPRFTERMDTSPDCPRHCMDQDDLERCSENCDAAFVREIVNMIREKQRA